MPKKSADASKVLQHNVTTTTRAFSFESGLVTIKVGPKPTAFLVHESLLISNSPFFAAALRSEWLEGQARTVTLPDARADAFNVYLNWIYCRTVPLAREPTADPRTTTTWPLMLAAYTLGDQVLDVDFKDAVLDAMALDAIAPHNGTTFIPHRTWRAAVYAKTGEGSQARRWLTHLMGHLKNTALVDKTETPELLADMVRLMMVKDDETTFAAVVRCEFHEHAPGSHNCYRVKYPGSTTITGN